MRNFARLEIKADKSSQISFVPTDLLALILSCLVNCGIKDYKIQSDCSGCTRIYI